MGDAPRLEGAEGAPAPAAPDGGGWGVYGQEQAVSWLRQALRSGRLAHAYLFAGPAGVGRATLARRLAQALCCESGGAEEPREMPCRECQNCRLIEGGSAPDVETISTGGLCDESGANHRDHAQDGSTRIRVCQVRRLERLAALAPFSSPRRIFVVDSADELQHEAAQALLKTLEEPPGGTLLVLLAGDPEALPATVRSRCQLIRLAPLAPAALRRALEEHASLAPDDAARLARDAGGRYGSALRLHADPSHAVLRESAVTDLERLTQAGRTERLDYADTLARRWGRERASVLELLDHWRDWWRERLRQASGLGAEPAGDAEAAREAAAALSALQRARSHLQGNVVAQFALEILMLDLPERSAPSGEEADAEPVLA